MKRRHGDTGTRRFFFFFTVSPFHCLLVSYILLAALWLLNPASAFAEELRLEDLINEALKNNHEVLVSESKWKAATYRIPQAKSLPDPMVIVGYQNEGWKRYTFGKEENAQWMFSASQMFPYPGKLSLKGEIAASDAESMKASLAATRFKTISTVKELYYDLYLAYRDIDLIRDKTALFSRVEEAALARYSTGMAPQQEVLMAQTEKYMLLEKEEMLKQKVQALEAMLNAAIGRDVNAPLGRPVDPVPTSFAYTLDELIKRAYENSPEIKIREKIVASAESKVLLAEKEYYPDFTIAASVFKRAGEFSDMWSLATTINIPLYYKTKQRQAVSESKFSLSGAAHDLEGAKVMLSSSVKDNYSMFKTSEKLMDLYKNGLIPKTYQDFELAIVGYTTGKVQAITVISRLKSLLDLELLYWGQFVEREKAIARIEAITAVADSGSGVR